jgi:hypothetical protein
MSNDDMPEGFGPEDRTVHDRATTEYASVGLTFMEHPLDRMLDRISYTKFIT